MIWRNAGLAKSRVSTLHFRRANFQLLKELLGAISWQTVLKGTGRECSRQLLQDTLLPTQELSISQQKKWSRGDGRPVWPSKDLQLKLMEKRDMSRKWKQGCVAWEEYISLWRMTWGSS